MRRRLKGQENEFRMQESNKRVARMRKNETFLFFRRQPRRRHGDNDGANAFCPRFHSVPAFSSREEQLHSMYLSRERRSYGKKEWRRRKGLEEKVKKKR